MLNRLIQKILFTNEIMPYEKFGKFTSELNGNVTSIENLKSNNIPDPKKLKYEIEGVPAQ
jgi:hypothetical protein